MFIGHLTNQKYGVTFWKKNKKFMSSKKIPQVRSIFSNENEVKIYEAFHEKLISVSVLNFVHQKEPLLKEQKTPSKWVSQIPLLLFSNFSTGF